jgi:Ca2+-binding RTX toxin-like protein
MLFNGSNGSEIFDASANGERVRFTRNLGNIVMDLDGVEAIDLKAFGGADTVTINDLSGTDLGAIDIDLAAPGGVGDAQIDAVIVNATDSDDVIGFSGDSSTTKVLGPGAEVTVGGAELANDSLIVNGLAGNDAFDPSALTGTAIRIVADGGDGNDVVLVNGLDSDEQFTATANGTLVRVNRISPTPFFVDAAAESLVVVMNGGNDTFSATGNLAALIQITVDGGDGNDTILGSNGVDLLIGGDGNDFVDGQQGNDVAFLGAGDDVFQWDPGDGSDVVEGQDGADTLVFNGSNTGEIFDVSANGERVRFTRNLGNIVMDLNGVEAIDLNTFGGSDVVTVNDATGTDLVKVDVDLAAFGGVGDAQIDSVVVNAGGGSDVVEILGAGTSVSIAGLSTHVTLSGAEAANDQLVLNTQAGDDAVDASALPAGVVILSLNGGDGHDDLTGSAGADTIVGGRGNDVVMGQEGSDVINWSTGDGSDVIDGGEGFDFVQINGSEIADRMDVASDAGRVIVRRTSSALTDATNNGALDIGTVESIGISLLGGDDRVTFGSLIGVTDLTGLSVFAGAGNDFIGASDLTLGLFADAGDGRDTIYGGLSHDTLLGGDGRDSIDGGEGNDLILGGADKDIIKGGDGNDLLGGDEGDDLIYGGLGDDSLDGGDGFDVLDGGDGTDNGVNGEVLINFP